MATTQRQACDSGGEGIPASPSQQSSGGGSCPSRQSGDLWQPPASGFLSSRTPGRRDRPPGPLAPAPSVALSTSPLAVGPSPDRPGARVPGQQPSEGRCSITGGALDVCPVHHQGGGRCRGSLGRKGQTDPGVLASSCSRSPRSSMEPGCLPRSRALCLSVESCGQAGSGPPGWPPALRRPARSRCLGGCVTSRSSHPWRSRTTRPRRLLKEPVRGRFPSAVGLSSVVGGAGTPVPAVLPCTHRAAAAGAEGSYGGVPMAG